MTPETENLLIAARAGNLPSDQAALSLADETDLDALVATAKTLRDQGHGNVVSYSRKVFIPLTHLCRDVCHYCTFAQPPKKGERAYMTPEEILAVARAGEAAGCREALFTLGDKPELRYRAARDELTALGYDTTLDYLRDMAQLVLDETSLLPHLNPGILTAEDLAMLRPVSVSQGIMLESTSLRLLEKGQCHHGSPDKDPAVRLATLDAAGEQQIPFTSGILIGIGETRAERIETLLALRQSHDKYGHVQEIIVQNFCAKPDTRMAAAPEPDAQDLIWTIAVARILFGPKMNIQAPPNLSPGALSGLVDAGINDWGGVSPVTPDFVNPEAPWPHLDTLRAKTAACGRELTERLALYPGYALHVDRWLDDGVRTPVLRAIDGEGFARVDGWSPGDESAPETDLARVFADPAETACLDIGPILDTATRGGDLSEAQVVRLLGARGDEITAVCAAANDLRKKVNGDTVTYVVNRNINYTNICYFRCQFCAFSKGKLSENLRGRPYDLGLDEIVRRSREAWDRGATEVCMQGGIHPDYNSETYLDICHAVKDELPNMHVHAFSPLEVWQGAATSGLSLREFLMRLMDAGLDTLPGTAAEILDDEVRAVLCPDKINTKEWFEVMETAHELGFRTTSTIMHGHIERPEHVARHLLRIREVQARTGGFTEFVPLPFVHMEAPIYLKGKARKGPTFREAVLIHAVARLALHPHITNIQTSWVKMGPEGVKACLNAGANDLGGTLMNETITRAAGATHGQEMPPAEMEALIRGAGRTPEQRSTAYGTPPADRVRTSFDAPPLSDVVNTPPRKSQRRDIDSDSDRDDGDWSGPFYPALAIGE
ncbi:MAG: 5-amino-6-(D-ribitylamino)uracil--L-tyrosine 4-hydroxyphenyl transferase CofH [Rhodospirillales bacterium]|nr:5-amino-6-(D-ribitylamino)uracil--L-tyrosine 4-hydroxyphenyl transferase CofH [Rhodospirillales bacterium]